MDPITVAGAVTIAGLKYVGQPTAGMVKDFVGRIFGPTADALGQVLADPVVEWRQRRAERAQQVIEDAAKLVAEQGKEPQAVPARVLMPLLEKGSLEEDDSLHARWVALLANASMNPDAVHPAFVTILGELSPLEARLLARIYDMDPERVARLAFKAHLDERKFLLKQLSVGALVQFLAAPDRDPYVSPIDFYMTVFNVVVINLERLRLIKPGPAVGPNWDGETWVMTPFGIAFMIACSVQRKRENAQLPSL